MPKIAMLLICSLWILVCGIPTYADDTPVLDSTITSHLVYDKWTGDDKPFLETERKFDKAIKGGFDPLILARQYRVTQPQQLLDAHLVFRWAYASFYASLVNSTPEAEREFIDANESLKAVSSPHTYSYSRLRFLMDAEDFPDPNLKGLGERLLRVNPQDYLVKDYLVSVLNVGVVPADTREAIYYAHDLIRSRPKDTEPYTVLAFVYYRQWLATDAVLDGDQAIAAYQRYLQLAPKNASFRGTAEKLIQDIRSGGSNP